MKSTMRILTPALALTVALWAGVGAAQETKRYDGAKVTIAMHAGHFVRTWDAYKPQVKDLLGIDLEIIGVPVNEMFDKEMLELAAGSGAYDLVMFNPAWMGDYVDFLAPLDEYMAQSDPAWEDVHPGFREWANTYGGKRYAIQLDGDIIMGYYRKDLFDDPKEKEAFKAKYGYELAPPANWDQVLDIQEFFTRDTNADGVVDLWGYADQAKRGRSFYWYMLRYLANYPGDKPQYFDPATMQPKIDTPEAVAALENYVKAVKNGPPGVLGWEWDELNSAFLKGNVAMMFHWPDEGKQAGQLAANVPGATIGFFVPPKRSMTFGGWILGVSKDSANPEAAYAAMRWLLSPETSLEMVTNPDSGQDFFRVSHFNAEVTKALVAPDYLATFNAAIAALFPELRIPGGFEYYDTLDVQVQKALAGEASAKDALGEAANLWNAITDRLGRDAQKAKYQAAMGES